MPAALGEVLALLQLFLPEIAAHQRAAMPIHPISEVLASHADACSFPTLQIQLIHKAPLLHTNHKTVRMY